MGCDVGGGERAPDERFALGAIWDHRVIMDIQSISLIDSRFQRICRRIRNYNPLEKFGENPIGHGIVQGEALTE